MSPSTSTLTSPQSATRLSTTGIVLICVGGALVLAVGIASVVLLRRRRTTTESRWKSVWILCRRRRPPRDQTSNPRTASQKHNRKYSTASTLHDCQVVVDSTLSRVPQGWFLQGSPQQEITDPYEVSAHGYKYAYPQHGFYQPKPLDARRDSMATTLVPSQRPSPLRATFGDGVGEDSKSFCAASPLRSTFAGHESLSPGSTSPHYPYPFAPSEPNSPVYPRFAGNEGSVTMEHTSTHTQYLSPVVPPARPAAMTRQISEAPSLPRSVSPTSPVEVELERFESIAAPAPVRTSPKRPNLQRGTVTPRIAVCPPQPADNMVSQPSYFSHGSSDRTPHQAAPAPSPGLHNAFRSAFFLDAGPRGGIAISSMPQTPAAEEW